jgi:hypothetical protein
LFEGYNSHMRFVFQAGVTDDGAVFNLVVAEVGRVNRCSQRLFFKLIYCTLRFLVSAVSSR